MNKTNPQNIFDSMTDIEKNKISILMKLGSMERFGASKNKNTQIAMNCLLDVKEIFSEDKNVSIDEINQAFDDALLNTLYELSYLQNNPSYKSINIFEIITNHKKRRQELT